MMRNFNTVVLERLKYFTDDFATEPYEVGWASEAIFFIRIHEIEGSNVSLDATVQISADGINWLDEGTHFSRITDIGDRFVKVSNFGGWLRLNANVQGGNQPKLKLTIQLALKD
jgi:hypothetical protein